MPRPLPQKPINPLRNRPQIHAPPTALARKAAEGAAAARPARRACPNKQCSNPQVEEGICHNCGTVVDDSNIVAEIQFGENSSGAAVIQGSFVAADQGAAKSLGPAFRRAGGEEGREATIREGRRIMANMAAQLPQQIPEHVIGSGHQIFKLAAMHNFIQGRRMDMVAAVCLYSACRKEKECRVMLIDFADHCQVNVFKLGHTFKSLHAAITISKDGIRPILPEELIWRFAGKLEFGPLTNKVAEDAIRMVKRMSFDWMVMGRRPSGVCGACLILAARMNNFRRTITEVVYIVKVTTHTIQKRLEEFKLTSSSTLTIEEFLNNEWTNQAAHDPPSFYEKTDDFQRNRKKRKRRKAYNPEEEEDNEDGENSDEDGPDKRQKTATPGAGSPAASEELRRDADGFAIPPRPTQSHEMPIDPDLVDATIEDQSGTSFAKLIEAFGDVQEPTVEEPAIESVEDPKQQKKKKGPDNRPIHVSDGWAEDERILEDEISEMISDPNTIEHAASFAQAAERAAAHMLLAQNNSPQKEINMDVHIGEDEFADDPEVLNCLLSSEQAAAKEKIWVNDNKSWLRKQQLREYQRLMAENGPKKATRNRKKKPRIGEGQTSAASSPGEAAVNLMKQRAYSRKINYDAIKSMFNDGGNALGSAATSRVTSRAGSVGSREPSEAPTERSDVSSSILKPPKPRSRGTQSSTATTASPAPVDIDDEPDSDDDDYVKPKGSERKSKSPLRQTGEKEEDWRGNFQKSGEDNEEGFEDEEDDYVEDFENGDVDDAGFDAQSVGDYGDEDY